MISGLDLNKTTDYILKNDKDNPTVWKIGVLPSYLFARLASDSVNKEIEMSFKIIQVGLKGWDNFNIPFETKKEDFFGRELNVVPMDVLERIPLEIISELSLEIMKINQVGEKERKN